jgi:predicted RNase H-like HicB family nuclease
MAVNQAPELLQPYAWVLTPQNPGFLAEILEFPGCTAKGDSPEEAIQNLVKVAERWIEAQHAEGKNIPPPLTNYDTRGQFALRLPGSLYNKVRVVAAREKISTNALITLCLSEFMGFLTGQTTQRRLPSGAHETLEIQAHYDTDEKQIVLRVDGPSQPLSVRVKLSGDTPVFVELAQDEEHPVRLFPGSDLNLDFNR